jgi:DNA-binding CsgD family transcriptional regulator
MHREARKSAILRQAFDAVATLEQTHDLPSLNAAVARTFNDLGFDVFVGLTHVAPGGIPDVAVLFGDSHKVWEARYLEQNYQSHDACIDIAIRRSDPFFWSEAPSLTHVTPDQQRVFDEAAECGLSNGFLVPMHGHDGSIATVLLSGDRIDARDPQIRCASHMLALYFGSAGRRIIGQATRRANGHNVHLTVRQIECLRWVRAGKSSSDIGDILGLSSRTVDFYILNACQRLGVRTRAQAVAEAAIRGLIAL